MNCLHFPVGLTQSEKAPAEASAFYAKERVNGA